MAQGMGTQAPVSTPPKVTRNLADRAPRLALVIGRSVRLSQFRGKPVLVNFWATGCTACRAEMPAIERVWERHRAQGFQVLKVDYQELNQPAMRSFFGEVTVHFGSALDPDGKIAAAYAVTIGLPDSFLIDRHGIIRIAHLGGMPPDYMEQQGQELL